MSTLSLSIKGIKLGDLATSKEKLTLLKTDKEFYNKCSTISKLNYNKYFHEDKFNPTR